MMSAGESREMHSPDQDEARNVQRGTDEQSTHTSSPAIGFLDADEMSSYESREKFLLGLHPWRYNRDAEREAGVPNALQLEPSYYCVISTQLKEFALSRGVQTTLVDFVLGPCRDQEHHIRCRQKPWDSEIEPLSLEDLLDTASAEQRSITLLLAAWGSWDKGLLNLLLNKCSPSDADFSFTDDAGRSALHLAALRGNDVCLKMLIRAGAPVNVLDKKDRAVTPLCCAAYGRHKDCVKLLLAKGATDQVVDADNGATSATGTASGAAKMSALYCAALSCGRPPRFIEGSTLHESCVAAGNDSFECVQYLLTKKNVNVNFRHQVTGMTPMHLAAMYDSPRVLSALLKRAGGNVDCWVEKTLDNPYYREEENIRGTWNITPLHLAAAYRNLECIQALLEAGPNANGKATTHDRGHGSCWVTPLHLAVASSHYSDLLLGVDWSFNFIRTDTSEWVRWCMTIDCWRGASKSERRYNCVSTLLETGKADPNPPTNGADRRAVSPLLMAVLNELGDRDEGQCVRTVRLLLQRGGDACARYSRRSSVYYGENLPEKSVLEEMAEIYPKEVLRRIFEDAFNDCVTLWAFHGQQVPSLVSLDFKMFIISCGGNADRHPVHYSMHEMRLFTGLIQVGQSQLLTHPLCEALIHLKWEKTKMFFVLNLLVYIVFAVVLTWYTWSVFREPCMRQKQCSDDDLPLNNLTTANNITGNCTQECQVKKLHTALDRKRYLDAPNITAAWHTLMLLVGLLVAKELIQLFSDGHRGIKPYMRVAKYHLRLLQVFVHLPQFKWRWNTCSRFFCPSLPTAQLPVGHSASSWENLVQMAVLICSAILLAAGADGDDDRGHYIPAWMYHIAAITVFAAWVEVFFIVGRFPSHGVHIQMFIMVLKNFAEFFAAYIALILAFAASFAILFCSVPTFRNPFEGLLSTLVMMTGEMGYSENLFFRTDAALDMPGTSHMIFFLFLFFVGIVMVNLLIGMAVNDIQGLRKNAKLERLVRRCELIAHIESWAWKIESWASSKFCLLLPRRILGTLRRAVFLHCRKRFLGRMFINIDHEPDEHRHLPKELVEAAITLAQSTAKGTQNRYNHDNSPTCEAQPILSSQAHNLPKSPVLGRAQTPHDANGHRQTNRPAQNANHQRHLEQIKHLLSILELEQDYMERRPTTDFMRKLRRDLQRMVNEAMDGDVDENQQGAPVVPIHPVNRPLLDVAPDDSDQEDEETREDESLV